MGTAHVGSVQLLAGPQLLWCHDLVADRKITGLSGVMLCREFEVNGVGLRPAMKDQVQKVEQELQQKKAAARDARAAKVQS